jgi:hypothetical protein
VWSAGEEQQKMVVVEPKLSCRNAQKQQSPLLRPLHHHNLTSTAASMTHLHRIASSLSGSKASVPR